MCAASFETCSEARRLRDGELVGTGERCGPRVGGPLGAWCWERPVEGALTLRTYCPGPWPRVWGTARWPGPRAVEIGVDSQHGKPVSAPPRVRSLVLPVKSQTAQEPVSLECHSGWGPGAWRGSRVPST